MKSFIDDYREAYGVEPICKVLPIAPSTYYEHAARKADPALQPARMRRDEVLCGHVQRVWSENFEVYGVLRSGDNCGVKASMWRAARSSD